MKNVTYYSAGAGSGKTYTLTHLLADKIKSGIAPSEVILTTFTKAAAADFRERARAALYEAGMYEQAALLDQALIGTVHSVGEAFIRRYWYLLGLSPEMKVMDEDSTKIYISQSLSELPTADDIRMFREFREAFNITKSENNRSVPDPMFWKSWLNSIIEMGASYRVEDFKHSCEYSLAQIRKYFKPDHDFEIDNKLMLEMLSALRECDYPGQEGEDKRRFDAVTNFMNKKHWEVVDYLELGKYLKDTKKNVQKKHQKAVPDILNLSAKLLGIWQSNQVYAMMERLVVRLFELAEQWRKEYVAYKQEMRIIDFNDMEVYTLQLLKNPAIAEEISGRYKCLMVDEFQDSSPIQVDIFNSLSNLVGESFWCGDSKQAIYGFRGADTDLTEAVADMVPTENFLTLDTSYRSEPDVVKFCNSVFTRAFDGKLSKEKVELNTHREKKSYGPNLIHWSSTESNKVKFHQHLAEFVEDFINEYADHEGDSFNYNDIAILARTRAGSDSEINQIAEALSAKGIPVSVGAGSLLMQKETELMTAILTLVTDPTNQLAKAKIAHLTTPGFDIATLIDSRLESLQDDETRKTWLDDNPLIQRTLSLRKEWTDQSVSALVESVIVELNLRSVLKSWNGSWHKRENNLYQIADLATKYEDHCQVMTLGATVTGFLDYLQSSEATSAGDNNGVVISTYHQSKGLQWKNVILVSLDHNFADDKEIVLRHIFGVQKVRTAEPTSDNLFPEMLISLIPQVFPVAFGKISMPDNIFNTILNTEEYATVKSATIEECKRLLYVGMTRAKDKLITTTKAKGRGCSSPVAWLQTIGITDIPSIPAEGEIDLCGTGINAVVKQVPMPETDNTMIADRQQCFDLPEFAVNSYADKFVAPSHTGRTDKGTATIVATRNERIPFKGSNDIMNLVGDCIHNIYAACRGDKQHDIALAESMVKAFHFEEVLPDAEAIINARQFLTDYLSKIFKGKTTEYHELPFAHQTGNQIVRGSMDFVWETAEGCVLIDFKTYPGRISDVTEPTHKHYAGHFKPQFDCYTAALNAVGKTVLARLVFYPVSGTIVQL